MKKDIGIERYLIKYYSKMLIKNPASLIFLPLANAFKLRGNYDIAIEICQTGLKNHPESTSGRALLGELYFLCKKYKEAEKELTAAARSDAGNILAKNILLAIYLKDRNIIEANKIKGELAKICPTGNNLRYIKKDIKKYIESPQLPYIEMPSKSIPTDSWKSLINEDKAHDLIVDNNIVLEETKRLFSGKELRTAQKGSKSAETKQLSILDDLSTKNGSAD